MLYHISFIKKIEQKQSTSNRDRQHARGVEDRIAYSMRMDMESKRIHIFLQLNTVRLYA